MKESLVEMMWNGSVISKNNACRINLFDAGIPIRNRNCCYDCVPINTSMSISVRPTPEGKGQATHFSLRSTSIHSVVPTLIISYVIIRICYASSFYIFFVFALKFAAINLLYIFFFRKTPDIEIQDFVFLLFSP